MIKSLAISLAKRYAVKAIQEAISAKRDDVGKWSTRVGVWVARLRLVVAFLERLCARLADGELTDDEVKRTTDDLCILSDEVTR